jgi:hypothetical protein
VIPGRGLIPSTASHQIFARLVQVLAPGESDLVAFLECYFDESGSDDNSTALCVAGYLFDKEKCIELDRKWEDLLGRFSLPYFRMSSCAHQQKPFNHLTREECIDVEKEAISLINEHALLGAAVAVNEADYNSWFDQRITSLGSPYTFCCWQVLASIRTWIIRNGFEGDIAYFFEAGHQKQSEANAVMNRLFKDKGMRESYHYVAHSFVDKKKVRPVQTADILAWQQATQLKRWLKNDYRIRADFQALAEKPRHELFVGNRKTLGGLIAFHRRVQKLPITDGVTGLFGDTWFWSPFSGEDGISI